MDAEKVITIFSLLPEIDSTLRITYEDNSDDNALKSVIFNIGNIEFIDQSFVADEHYIDILKIIPKKLTHYISLPSKYILKMNLSLIYENDTTNMVGKTLNWLRKGITMEDPENLIGEFITPFFLYYYGVRVLDQRVSKLNLELISGIYPDELDIL